MDYPRQGIILVILAGLEHQHLELILIGLVLVLIFVTKVNLEVMLIKQSTFRKIVVRGQKELQMELNTEKETVKAFQVSIQQELAQVKNMKPVVTGNGESVANPVAPVAEGISDDEREFYGSAVQRGNITAEQYKSITGIDYQ